MKNLKYSLITLFFLSLFSAVFAQDDRMEKDLKVMEEILTELFMSKFGDGRNNHFGEKKAEASYIKGYGIMLKLPQISQYRGFTYSSNYVISTGRNTKRNKDPEYSFKYDLDSLTEAHNAKVIALMKSFLSLYGDLAGGLNPDEKIFIQYNPKNTPGNGFSTYHVSGNPDVIIASVDDLESKSTDQITAEVKYQDILQFKSGKQSKEAFEKKINIKSIGKNNEEQLEYKILSRIFQSIFEKEQEGMFSTSGKPFLSPQESAVSFQVLSGFGVVYKIQLYYPSQVVVKNKGNDDDFAITIKNGNELSEKRDQEMEKAYPKFLEEIKSGIVEYGRTLRSVNAEEMLLVEVEIPACKACEIPSRVVLSVKKSILESYDSRKISLEEAKKKINITPAGKASEKRENGFPAVIWDHD
ncbi:hypothetical protein [Flexithrix dorotheae]|uniref:hypothetical protein n=1 Tax=Flexithrix dorotheae TaxID=70993 RepID=UPI0003608721|nr:hypothetical protein [Flexithrix dorotheae]